MTNQLNIAMVQLNQRVGDLAANAAAMLDWRAKAVGADLVVFPEQQLIGYPAEDLVLKPAFAARAAEQLAKLAEATADGGPAMLVGSIFRDNGALYNGIALLDGGRSLRPDPSSRRPLTICALQHRRPPLAFVRPFSTGRSHRTLLLQPLRCRLPYLLRWQLPITRTPRILPTHAPRRARC